MMVLLGILFFFLLEKFMRLQSGSDDAGHGHSHGHAHAKSDKADDKAERVDEDKGLRKRNNNKETEKKADEKDEEKSAAQSRIAGYLNIIADTAHNVTDGMAIAASFLISTRVGITTTVAVFFHEIPHEVGDYAILIQSGFTKMEAMKVQFVTAIGALTGTVFTLITGRVTENSSAILAFTAGGFIYISMVSVIPTLLHKSSAKETVYEVVGISLGIGMMAIIGLYE